MSTRSVTTIRDLTGYTCSISNQLSLVSWLLVQVHVLVLVVLLCVGDLAPVTLEPQLQVYAGVHTFRGWETVEHWRTGNIWLGPHYLFLISKYQSKLVFLITAQTGRHVMVCLRKESKFRICHFQYGL